MKQYVYPYRTQKGHRSILEAIDKQDAMEYLSMYKDTIFCEIEMPENFYSVYFENDLDGIVDNYLANNKTFTTKG